MSLIAYAQGHAYAHDAPALFIVFALGFVIGFAVVVFVIYRATRKEQ